MPEASSTAARAWVERVLVQGAGEGRESVALAEVAIQAEVRLQVRMVDLVGVRGYAALVARALRLSQAEVPALAPVTVDPGAEGRLQGVRAFVESTRANGGSRVAEAGLIALLAQIIGLLITFVGEDLALRLVREVWPEPTQDVAVEEGRA